MFICPNLRHAYFFFCLHLRHDGWICLWACCIYLSSFNPNCLDLKHIVFICLDLNIALFNSIHVVCNFPDLSRMIFDGVDLSHVICICLDLKNVCLWCWPFQVALSCPDLNQIKFNSLDLSQVIFTCLDLIHAACIWYACIILHQHCIGPSRKHVCNEELYSINFNKAPLPTYRVVFIKCVISRFNHVWSIIKHGLLY